MKVAKPSAWGVDFATAGDESAVGVAVATAGLAGVGVTAGGAEAVAGLAAASRAAMRS